MKSEPVVFKCDDGLWQMMEKGIKTWDARVFDITDPRIQRLAAGHWEENPAPGRRPVFRYDETFICFLNKETGQTLQFRYRGFITTGWAPGWIIIHLGDLAATLDSDGNVIS